MKVIGPLFLDDLQAELPRIRALSEGEKPTSRVSGEALGAHRIRSGVRLRQLPDHRLP